MTKKRMKTEAKSQKRWGRRIGKSKRGREKEKIMLLINFLKYRDCLHDMPLIQLARMCDLCIDFARVSSNKSLFPHPIFLECQTIFKHYRGGAARMRRSADISTVLQVNVGLAMRGPPGLMCLQGRGMVGTSGKAGEDPFWEVKEGLWDP